MIIKGKTWKYGDDINTDLIIPARRMNVSEPDELAKYCMEDEDTEFVNQVQAGDIMVALKNFGCGSSREHAPLAIKYAGISLVIAKSFARIFFRNCINIGLPILEAPECAEELEAGDELEVNLEAGEIKNITQGKTYQATPFPDFMQQIIKAGGLLNYLKVSGKIQ